MALASGHAIGDINGHLRRHLQICGSFCHVIYAELRNYVNSCFDMLLLAKSQTTTNAISQLCIDVAAEETTDL